MINNEWNEKNTGIFSIPNQNIFMLAQLQFELDETMYVTGAIFKLIFMQKWVPNNFKKSCKRFICFLSLCVIGWNHIISIFSIWRQTYHGRTTSNVVVDADIHATLTKKMPQNCINLTFKKNRMIWGWHLAHGMHVQYMFIITKGHKKTLANGISFLYPWRYV